MEIKQMNFIIETNDDLTAFLVECDAHAMDVDGLYAAVALHFSGATIDDLSGALKRARREVAFYLAGDRQTAIDLLVDPLVREDAREIGVIHERNLSWLDALSEIIDGLPLKLSCTTLEIKYGKPRLLARIGGGPRICGNGR
jgi:hypothetical protein